MSNKNLVDGREDKIVFQGLYGISPQPEQTLGLCIRTGHYSVKLTSKRAGFFTLHSLAIYAIIFQTD